MRSDGSVATTARVGFNGLPEEPLPDPLLGVSQVPASTLASRRIQLPNVANSISFFNSRAHNYCYPDPHQPPQQGHHLFSVSMLGRVEPGMKRNRSPDGKGNSHGPVKYMRLQFGTKRFAGYISSLRNSGCIMVKVRWSPAARTHAFIRLDCGFTKYMQHRTHHYAVCSLGAFGRCTSTSSSSSAYTAAARCPAWLWRERVRFRSTFSLGLSGSPSQICGMSLRRRPRAQRK